MRALPAKIDLSVLLAAVAVLACLTASCRGGEKTPPSPAGQAAEAAGKEEPSPRKVYCYRAPAAVVVDGVIDEWAGADTLRLDDPREGPDPNQVKIYTLWNENYLYIAYRVSDRNLVGYQTERDHRALYKDDMIEVLLDPRKDATDLWLEDDIVYHINLLGQVKDDRGTTEGISDAGWQSEAVFAVSCEGTLNDSTDRDRGFCVELAVPWSEIGAGPEAGLTLGINFAAGDAEGPDEHLWDWCGAHPFRQPSAYGRLELK
ncbi:MAG: carbohydrate-binding family 9-like protein [Candidatus Glassbacteria bacterium]|nr:carbohydrate-binding family 9-like protein [Candidatus Glassbacteria bacterium]